MIADRESEYEVVSTIEGDKVKMSIAEEALNFIMSVLTNLYSNPKMAVLREYATNAFDSHIAAGIKRAIEITLPSHLAPVLRIKDFGIGMSKQDIHDIYSKYGASTKRDTNDQTGMLGLGCKSALTYASQFTLIGVKDGVRVQVSISRDDDDGGSMTIVDESLTDEPNGVEIVIPAKRWDNFEPEVNSLFRFWPAGSVLVNGKEPAKLNGLKITDSIYVVRGEMQSYIVMGNVPYPADIRHGLSGRNGIVAYVPIGAVHFTPSREALHMTTKTKNTITEIESMIAAGIEDAVQREVDKADNKYEAARTLAEWDSIYGIKAKDITYDGEDVPRKFELPLPPAAPINANAPNHSLMVKPMRPKMCLVERNSSYLNSHQWSRELWIAAYSNATFFYGFTTAKFASHHKKKINMWAEDNSPGTKFYVLLEDKPDVKTMEWIDPSRLVNWEDVNAYKLYTAKGRTIKKISGSYKAYVKGTYEPEIKADDLDTKNPLVFFQGDMGYAPVQLIQIINPDSTLVILSKNRVNKFVRDFPMAIDHQEAIAEGWEKWKATVSKEDLTAMAFTQNNPYSVAILRDMDPNKVDDPDLKAAVALVARDLTNIKDTARLYRAYVSDCLDLAQSTINDPLAKYPLFGSQWEFSRNKAPRYEYINAMYHYRKGK